MTPAQKIEKLNQSITDMKRKELLPKHTLGYFTQDRANLIKLNDIHERQIFKEWSCSMCGITVYGPKKLLLEHHKIHSQKRELRENEIYQKDYKLY